MKVRAPSVFPRAAFVIAVMGAAYGIGRWQGTLEVEARTPVAHAQTDPVAAAKNAARAAAYAQYLDHKKFIESHFKPHPAADIVLSKDPKAGMEKLAQLPPGAKTQDIYRDAFSTWAKDPKDATDAAVAALALPDGLDRTAALQGLTEGWAESDAKACLDWANSLQATDPHLLPQAILAVGTQNNDSRQPALAAQYVDELQDASARNNAIQKIGTQWATDAEGRDATNALVWLDQVATGENYDSAITSIFTTLAQQNPANAATLIDNITDPGVRDTEMAYVTSFWSRQDPEAALAWVQGLPDTDQAARDKAMNTIISAIAARDPAAAAAFVQNSIDPSAFLPAASAIAENLAFADPQAALAWANNLPEGDLKTKTLNSVLDTISTADFASAWDYAVNLSVNDDASAIMNNLVGAQAKKNPAQAAALLKQFPNETAQIAATSAVASTWALQDSQGFSAWVNTLPPGNQRDAAASAALKAMQAVKLPEPERDSLVRALTQAIQSDSAP